MSRRHASEPDVERNVRLLLGSADSFEASMAPWLDEKTTLRLCINKATLDENALSAELASSILRQLRDNIVETNLYEQRLPVSGDQFFGRRGILDQLRRDIERGKVCGVFGLRKAGKTSIIGRVHELLDDQGDGGGGRTVFIFRDLENIEEDDPVPEILKDLRAKILIELRKRQSLRTHELAGLNESAGVEAFQRALQVILSSLQDSRHRIVIALDEIESLLPVRRERSQGIPIAQFFGMLRSLVQENDNFCVLVSGLTSHVIEAGDIYGRPNPFFAWAVPRFVGPLKVDEAADLIRILGQRMALAWSEPAIDALIAASGGYPFFLRTLASVVQQRTKNDFRPIESADVQGSLRQWRREVAANVKEVFDTLERWYPNELTLLELASTSASRADLADLADQMPIETNHLVQLGLLTEDSEGILQLGPLAAMRGQHA